MTNSVAKNSPEIDIKDLLHTLQNGGFLLVKGSRISFISCDATDNKPVETLLNVSNQHPDCDKVVLLDNVSRTQAYTNDLPDIAWDLFELSEKPLLLIPDNLKNLASNLIFPVNDIAFGLADDNLLRNLCSRFRKPLFCIYFLNNKTEGASFPDNLLTINTNSNKTVPSKIKLGKGNQIEILRS